MELTKLPFWAKKFRLPNENRRSKGFKYFRTVFANEFDLFITKRMVYTQFDGNQYTNLATIVCTNSV